MKRALKKREKAVLKNTPSNDDAPVEHLENLGIVVNPKANCRVRTQAAMIGLAISMGTTSLLVTRQSDQAQAADPAGSRKPASTIPAASDTTVKFAPMLKTQTVLSASMTENPVITEPTAISQLPGLEAKWQVAASGISVQVPVPRLQPDTTTANKSSLNSQAPVSQGLSTGIQANETVGKLSSGDRFTNETDKATAHLTGEQQPQAGQNTEASGKISAQLKAQQQFALSRLQEKSNRLRNSLAELRSEETPILSKTDIASTQPKTIPKAGEISPDKTLVENSSIINNYNQESLLSGLKQQQTNDSNPEALTIPVPSAPTVVGLLGNTTYEVKPGDTLAAIALRYNISLSELVKANSLSNPNQLKISQRLIIPLTPLDRSRAIQVPVLVNPNGVYSSTIPQASNPPVASSQLPVPGNNNNVSIPTPVTNTGTATDTESTSLNPQGQGGDTPVPKIFAEMQQSQKSAQQGATTKDDHQGLQALRADIRRLQDKHRNQQPRNGVVPVATEPEQVNPPVTVAQTTSLQTEIKRLQEKYRNQQSGNAFAPLTTEPSKAAVPTPIAKMSSPEAEIQRLREQYRQQKFGNVIRPVPNESEQATIAIPVTQQNPTTPSQSAAGRKNTSIPIAVPRLKLPDYGSQSASSQSRTRRNNEPINPEFFTNINRPGNKTTTFSNDADISDNLGNLRGTKVAPQLQQQLPPLAAVDQYLPKPIDPTIPPPSTASTTYIWPAKGVLTSGYGRRWGRMHRGIDIANATGTPIYAVADGVVEKSGWNRGGYGILVDIRHADGTLTRYAHNSRTLVRAGQYVTQGQQIAHMGSTGFSTGPHTHFEVHPGGRGATDPIAFLPKERL
ncbi:peptidoglycan DD-metalloendopeptidase family protein [Umezakia ovalisporum]|uniref:peptidoglycan DD-metalloendopeptidase family protein n=1 Tax=Umezakia ovalisporum TaxID=75695 RepID=UPI0024731944|nr:peptidoglycan DD-metalloendopeptidase family protein [Umezakia ovalisporum]MDH6084683.1 peptidoglycan DD-metalloendopeptidase family protein [Umezakia ovalisporum TAC611]